MKAMGVTRIALCSPYAARNAKLEEFLVAEGFEVVGSVGMSEDLTKIHRLPGETAYRLGRAAVREAPGAEALYMAGGRLRVLDIIQELEDDIGIPVIASTPAVVWEMTSHFGAVEPLDGYGRLLREYPAHMAS
jgi:maleate cis-trans isomerase